MTKEFAKRISLIYGIILSISIITAGLSLIVCCTHLYMTGDRTYTPEKVAAYFSLIAIPVYVCLALILGGFLLEILLPADGKKKTFVAPAHMVLARAKRKTLTAGPVLTADIAKEENSRSIFRWLTVGVLCTAFAAFLLYGLNPNHFTENINISVIRGFTVMAGCLVFPFGVAIFTVYRNNASMQREAELRKQAKIDIPPPKREFVHWPLMAVRISVCLAAVVLLILGLMGNGTRDVLTKAINICTECIGLG